MQPTTERGDSEDDSPVEAEAQSKFRERLREVTPHACVMWILLATNVVVYFTIVSKGVEPMDPDAASLIFAGATGSLASLMFHPQSVSVGASGTLLGLVGALLSYCWFQRRSLHYSVTGRIWYGLLPVILYSFKSGRIGEIDVAAHAGGLVGGLLLGSLLVRPLDADRPAN